MNQKPLLAQSPGKKPKLSHPRPYTEGSRVTSARSSHISTFQTSSQKQDSCFICFKKLNSISYGCHCHTLIPALKNHMVFQIQSKKDYSPGGIEKGRNKALKTDQFLTPKCSNWPPILSLYPEKLSICKLNLTLSFGDKNFVKKPFCDSKILGIQKEM